MSGLRTFFSFQNTTFEFLVETIQQEISSFNTNALQNVECEWHEQDFLNEPFGEIDSTDNRIEFSVKNIVTAEEIEAIRQFYLQHILLWQQGAISMGYSGRVKPIHLIISHQDACNLVCDVDSIKRIFNSINNCIQYMQALKLRCKS